MNQASPDPERPHRHGSLRGAQLLGGGFGALLGLSSNYFGVRLMEGIWRAHPTFDPSPTLAFGIMAGLTAGISYGVWLAERLHLDRPENSVPAATVLPVRGRWLRYLLAGLVLLVPAAIPFLASPTLFAAR